MSSTNQACGEFPIPENPDLGQSAPPSVMKDCEAPAIPGLVNIAYDPDANPQFTAT
jgi:hypothetical protein